MKIKTLATVAIICAAFSLAACDDTTDTIGTSLTDRNDLLNVIDTMYDVKSASVVAGSVYSRNTTGYLGKIKDPETGNYITGNFMTQFNTLENYRFPNKDSLVIIENGDTIKLDDVADEIKDEKITADSCSIRLFYTRYYGDSLSTMNLTAHELREPMKEGVKYYSDYDPKELVRANGLKINKTYTLADMSIDAADRGNASVYTPNIKINLNKPYTDKDGKSYNNYGTYIMKKFYEDPNNFKNSYNFVHDVCPGFYFEMNDGLGSMAYIMVSQLNVYFKYSSDSTIMGTASFAGTEEVLQATNVSNDKHTIEKLAKDNTCTYVKTPAGIFTELELPIDEIMKGHEKDTINSAKISLARINDTNDSKYALEPPTALLMIPKDSLKNFFENGDIVDYKKSFIAYYNDGSIAGEDLNSYTFNNISNLITYLANVKSKGMATDPEWLNKKEHENWNKVLLIPVTVTTNSSTGQIMKVVHNMGLTSTKLVKGDDLSPLKIQVIYSRFNK